MTTFAKILRGGCLVLSAAAMLGAAAARSDDLPPELRTIIGTTTGNPTAAANGNILALDAAMFDLYDS